MDSGHRPIVSFSLAPILVSRDSGVASLTLNRPDKLNAFNPEMHELLREALEQARDEPPSARCCSPARARLLRRAGPVRAQRQRRAPRRSISRCSLGSQLQPAGAAPARAAEAGRLRGERRRRRRRRQHRARLRHRDRGALGELRAGVLASSAWCPTPAARTSCRASSAARAPWASRCSPSSSARRGGRALGPHLEGGRRRRS